MVCLLPSRNTPNDTLNSPTYLYTFNCFLAIGEGVSGLPSLPSRGSLALGSGEGRCYLSTNTHTALSHLASSFRVRMGDQSCQVSISSAIACTLHDPPAPLVPSSGDWDEPKNRVTESTVDYRLHESVHLLCGVLYVFSSNLSPSCFGSVNSWLLHFYQQEQKG